MSLIQDALKRKAEEQHPLPANPAPARPAPPEPPKKTSAPEPAIAIPPKNTSARKLFVILAIAIVLILLIIGSSIYLVLNRPAATLQPAPTMIAPTTIKAPAPAPAPARAPAPAQKPAPKPKIAWPELTFSGSAVGGDQILAIINGRMLSVGDRIKGATVLQIGRNEVLVEFKGEKRVLNVDDE